MGQEEFLKLLVAQISHQDPANPLDDKALVAQLAQFSAVEQAVETNKRLGALQASMMVQNHEQLSTLIGKQVATNSGLVNWQGGNTPQVLNFTLPSAAHGATVRLIDQGGEVVRSIKTGPLPPGNQKVDWDGRDDHGKEVVAGDYKLSVSAADAQGRAIAAGTETRGVVTGVHFGPQGAQLVVGNSRLNVQDIVDIKAQP